MFAGGTFPSSVLKNKMSYDLYFWRQAGSLSTSPEEVKNWRKKTNRSQVDSFPREVVRRSIRESFPDVQDGDFELIWEGAGSYFQITFGHTTERDVQLIVATCGWSLLDSPKTINQLIDTMLRLGCGVYNPQTGNLTEQPDSTA